MKRPLLKICGITSLEDARYAVRIGADAIGLILYPESPRFISLAKAIEIAAALPEYIRKVAVTVNASQEKLTEIVASNRFNVIQLHGDEDVETIQRLKRKIEVWKALTLRSAIECERAMTSPADCLVVDSRIPGCYGGTGMLCNWEYAAKLAAVRRVILAGGMTPENCIAAYQAVYPWGMDFNSGVETAPGKKNYNKLDALFSCFQQRKN